MATIAPNEKAAFSGPLAPSSLPSHQPNHHAKTGVVLWAQVRPLVLVSAAASIGIVADRFLPIGGATAWFVASVLGAVWFVLFRSRVRLSGLVLLSLIAVSMGIWHHHQWRLFPRHHVALQTKEGTATLIALRGRLADTPESGPLPDQNSTTATLSTIPVGVQSKFRLHVQSIRDKDHWIPTTGLINVQVNGHLLGLRAGDRVTLYGALSRPPQPMNPGQHNWGTRDRVSRILCELDVSYPDCVIPRSELPVDEVGRIWSSTRYRFVAFMADVRTQGLLLLDRFIEPPRNLLAGALLLGARDRMDKDRVEVFFHTGTIHLLAISGLHLGILTWCLFVFARSSRYRQSVLIVLMVFSLLYCYLTGLRDPVLRAAILVQVVCIGMIWRRNVLAYNALAAAAVAVLLFRPAAAFQPGTQLSFLAVAAMIWLGLNQPKSIASPIDQLIARSRPWYARLTRQVAVGTGQLAILGAVIWLVTLPLVMLHFHLVSPAALLLNVLLTLPITASLLSGFLVMLTGRVFKTVASVCGGVCDNGLAVVETTVQVAHSIPGAYAWTMGPTPGWCLVFYLGLLVGILWQPFACVMLRRKPSDQENSLENSKASRENSEVNRTLSPTTRDSNRPSNPSGFTPEQRATPWNAALLWLSAWLIVWWTIPIAASWAGQLFESKNELRCTFLSVGHGTCAVIELPDDRVLLYDCGRMGVPQTGVSIVSEFLWHRRISRIDGVILSHADADHYNLLPGLLERFHVGEVFVSPLMFNSDSPGVSVLRSAISEAGIPVRRLSTDDVLRFTGGPSPSITDSHSVAELRVLHPLPQGVRGSDNANSLVIEVDYQGRTILLPGDLEPPGLQDVMAETKRDCDLLMAPHHGSLRSLPREFSEWCTPEVVVISGGHDPEEILAQKQAFATDNCRVLHTADVGAVTVTVRNGQLQVEGFLPPADEATQRKFR